MRFAIAANGFAEGPAQALRDFLVARNADVVTMFHPLSPEQGGGHLITTYADGRRVRERRVRLPLRPPFSFAFDPFVPLLPPRVDVWFGFNPLACARGLVERSVRRASFVALWSVDFVPDRFGRGTLVTRMYDRLDRLCCARADMRIELSEAARAARNRRHGIARDDALIVPMGAWVDRIAATTQDNFARRRVVFLGHLVERQGVRTLLEALARQDGVAADIIGGGPLEADLRALVGRLGLENRVDFHGYIDDHGEIERLLSRCSVAVAPYKQREDTFTRYADPGKLKAYLAAGLPVVLTDVPPNARELVREAGAEIVDDHAEAIAAGIERALSDPEEWRARRLAALAYAQRFDWNELLTELFVKIGLGVPVPGRG